MIFNHQTPGGSITETDPIYTADKPNIALKSEVAEKLATTTFTTYQTEVTNSLGGKVDKVTGKVLSTNDFTDALKSIYDGYATSKADVSALSAYATTTSLLLHTSSTTNPHGVTASQIGVYTTSETDTLLGNKANDNSVVHLAGNEEIEGYKSFLDGVAGISAQIGDSDSYIKLSNEEYNLFGLELTLPTINLSTIPGLGDKALITKGTFVTYSDNVDTYSGFSIGYLDDLGLHSADFDMSHSAPYSISLNADFDLFDGENYYDFGANNITAQGNITASNFSGSSSGTNTGDETNSTIVNKLGTDLSNKYDGENFIAGDDYLEPDSDASLNTVKLNVSSDPATPQEGQIIYDGFLWKGYDGQKWFYFPMISVINGGNPSSVNTKRINGGSPSSTNTLVINGGNISG